MSSTAYRWPVIVSLLAAIPAMANLPDANPESTRSVAEAQRRGRELLQHGQASEAVRVLEERLPLINGNSTYLALLREAYGEAIKKLQLDRRAEEAAELQKRLQILDRGAKPAADPPPRTAAPASTLADAERAFGEKRYREAQELFATACAASPNVAKTHAAPWAYCKLFVIHEKLADAKNPVTLPALAELEVETTTALSLVPGDSQLDAFGRKVLDEVRRRRGETAGSTVVVPVKHTERVRDDWARAESPNFKLHHVQNPQRAEQVLRSAENARAAAIAKWCGAPPMNWSPPCDIYLHNAAADYARATGKGEASPGHATYQVQRNQVTRRRLDLRVDAACLLTSVVPHETTHLVLGDLFADGSLPRWADEGMAVTCEPREEIERYARTLHRCRANGELVPLAQLFKQNDYPNAKQITAFYVESVSIVEFLIGESDPKIFVQFLRDSERGLDAALQKHYGCRDVAELQDRWLRKTFAATDARGSSQP